MVPLCNDTYMQVSETHEDLGCVMMCSDFLKVHSQVKGGGNATAAAQAAATAIGTATADAFASAAAKTTVQGILRLNPVSQVHHCPAVLHAGIDVHAFPSRSTNGSTTNVPWNL